VDGRPLSNLRMADWRSRVAFVMQDTAVLDGTVSENLCIGRRSAKLEQIEEAAKRARAHEFITALPSGYETVLGEKGVQLSGGQAQRIALARALLIEPDLLVLDEATSNLDAETEAAIKQMLASLVGRRTVFVVAHRLTTVMRADKIIVLDKGRVVEIGRHAELMKRGGLYHRMVNLQMFVEEEADVERDARPINRLAL
jgi:ATP-binding cassette, subfamily B, bacterial